jgi:Tol biopolymer transport system component
LVVIVIRERFTPFFLHPNIEGWKGMLRSAASKVAGVRRIASMVFSLALVGFLAMTSAPAEAAFSAKDVRITFASDRTTGPGVHNPTGDYEIFTANRDGKRLKQLTFNTASDEYQAYSPDGKHIAFSTDRDGNYEVYEMGGATARHRQTSPTTRRQTTNPPGSPSSSSH